MRGNCRIASKATTLTAMQLFIVTVVAWNAASCGALWVQLHQANGARSHNDDRIRLHIILTWL